VFDFIKLDAGSIMMLSLIQLLILSNLKRVPFVAVIFKNFFGHACLHSAVLQKNCQPIRVTKNLVMLVKWNSRIIYHGVKVL